MILLTSQGEREVAVFRTKHWDHKSKDDKIESASPHQDAKVVRLYKESNPSLLTLLAAKSESVEAVKPPPCTTPSLGLQGCACSSTLAHLPTGLS